MSAENTSPPTEDYRSQERPTWCPGCGDFGVLSAVHGALSQLAIPPEKVVAISGIGCSSRFPFFLSTYGIHGLHGRTMPITTGVRAAGRDLHVFTVGGDGDAFAIGGGHLLHAARRNLDITYLVMDNSVYGLTKGQASPTSALGYATKTSPTGTTDIPLNPLMLAMVAGASFVGRAFSGRPKELTRMIVEAARHPGFALIDIFSPCPTFNKVNTFKSYREEVADLPDDHDPTDLMQAMNRAACESPRYLGVLYRIQRPTFLQQLERLKTGTEADRPRLLEDLFDEMR
jgi:2-oxoglutarate ferredoxin oxidoreductase subunit beta